VHKPASISVQDRHELREVKMPETREKAGAASVLDQVCSHKTVNTMKRETIAIHAGYDAIPRPSRGGADLSDGCLRV